MGKDLCHRSYTSAKEGPLHEAEGLHRGTTGDAWGCPPWQQVTWGYAESGGDGDEVVHVAAAAGALGATDGGVGERAPQRGAAFGELVLGERASQTQALDIASSLDSGGAYFYGSCCHDRQL
ncbi:hypothetical protein GCM10012285_15770 [Streptomyces kronopolitis]|uniref:Uncharacterized protein n=1 Tax=Streptomyces kronopolitis TaxID=1612435 RepID=A0ABQ2J4P8_9ACTN|nr:hypothetical protein GCM10012285_15770 [Streptomyces kronopolitis]